MRSHRLPHAYLFVGNEGVGKDAMALELARVLHCERRAEEACDACASCVKMSTLQHPDVRFITALPVGKNETADDAPLDKLPPADIEVIQQQLRLKGANPYHRITIPRASVIKVNSIREVRRQAVMSHGAEGRKIFILSNAEDMNPEAANTLLKTLEEPAHDTMLILTTSRPDALLSTIVSRCQLVRFDPLTETDIRTALMEREGVPEEKAALVARLAGGSYVQALELLATDLAELRQDVVSFIRTTLANNRINLVAHIEKLSAEKDRDFVVRYLRLMAIWFRDAFVLLNGGRIINLDQQDDLRKFTAKFAHADLPEVLAALDHAISLIYKNGYIQLVLLQLAVKLRRAILMTSTP
jgi:DNA polymerase-3 subunit delta'